MMSRPEKLQFFSAMLLHAAEEIYVHNSVQRALPAICRRNLAQTARLLDVLLHEDDVAQGQLYVPDIDADELAS